MINIGVIGYGYWGPNLVRNLAEVSRVTLTTVADSNPEKLALVQRRFPAVKTTADFQDLIRDPSIDAIAIATPVNTHFELGMAVLKAGKHLWLEKPMTETSLQARQLLDEAEKRNLILSWIILLFTQARFARCRKLWPAANLEKSCTTTAAG